MGAALGGGLGRYQGFYGLLADNIVDVDLVLADGSTITVSDSSHPDLFWALKGAGHNFGIVTRFTLKTYESPVQDWYFAQFAFTQDKLETFVTQVNKMMNNGTQPKELMNYFLYAWNPAISTTEVIRRILELSQCNELTTSSPSSYSPFTMSEPQNKLPLTQRPSSHWGQVSTTIPAYRTQHSLALPALETTAFPVGMVTIASNIPSAY